MNSSQAQASRSKWHKTQLLLQNGSIKPYVPETRKYNKANLKSMLEKYGMVYVKPERGTFGKGVMRVEQEAGQRFAYQYEETRQEFKHLDALYTSLSKHTGRKVILFKRESIYYAIKCVILIFGSWCSVMKKGYGSLLELLDVWVIPVKS